MMDREHTLCNDGLSGDKKHTLTKAIAQRIIHDIESLAYGSVEVIVHQSEVVQIEKKEKFRFQTNEPKERS